MAQADYGRRYDIDWLRTLAFGVLILYHTGMYYVADWGWHIKSEHTFAWLQDVMMLTAPWRMSLLLAAHQVRWPQEEQLRLVRSAAACADAGRGCDAVLRACPRRS